VEGNTLVVVHETFNNLLSGINGTIVNNQHFPMSVGLGLYGTDRIGNKFFGIVSGCDDRY
jgi:hypothetical protein